MRDTRIPALAAFIALALLYLAGVAVLGWLGVDVSGCVPPVE